MPSDLSFLLTTSTACEIMPQVFLSGNVFSAMCLSLRTKGKLKEQEPWKNAFHSSYFLSFKDINKPKHSTFQKFIMCIKT